MTWTHEDVYYDLDNEELFGIAEEGEDD